MRHLGCFITGCNQSSIVKRLHHCMCGSCFLLFQDQFVERKAPISRLCSPARCGRLTAFCSMLMEYTGIFCLLWGCNSLLLRLYSKLLRQTANPYCHPISARMPTFVRQGTKCREIPLHHMLPSERLAAGLLPPYSRSLSPP